MTLQEYKLAGESKPEPGYGAPEKFTAKVKAVSAKEAINQNCETMYQAGRCHILVKAVAVRRGRTWINIPMMQALGLE